MLREKVVDFQFHLLVAIEDDYEKLSGDSYDKDQSS